MNFQESVMSISFVTWNEKKHQQVKQLLAWVVDVSQLVYELEEPQISQIQDISYHKCMQAREHFTMPVLVEDAGIYFDEYNYFPGAYTKWLYEWIGLNGIQKLFQWDESKSASFVSVMSYMDEHLEHPIQFKWVVHGRLDFSYLWEIDEHKKLPYDLIFKPNELETIVELSYDKRMDWVNHRCKSIEAFKQWWLKQRS